MIKKIVNTTKKAAVIELFYDLVFVLAIGKLTLLLHHIENGVIPLLTFAKFLLILIALVKLWIDKADMVNRFGENSIKDKLFILVDMTFLLFMCKMFEKDWYQTFYNFNIAFICLLISMSLNNLMYLCNKTLTKAEQKILILNISKHFFIILGTITGLLIGSKIGTYVIIATIIISWLAPLTYFRVNKHSQVKLEHLVERLNLLVIMFFGELIIGIVVFFEEFNLFAFICMIIVGSLFLYYSTNFEKMIDLHSHSRLNFLIWFAHIVIVISVILVTISFELSSEHMHAQNELSHIFVVSLASIGLLMFVTMIILCMYFNRKTLQYRFFDIILDFAILFSGTILEFIFREDFFVVFSIYAVQCFALALHILIFNHNRTKKMRKVIIDTTK